MSLNIGLRYCINHDDSQWVENVDLEDGTQRYVFGRIDQKTVSFNTRFNYTMTPNLSLQVYAEPFVSAGDYSNFKELVDGRAGTTTTAIGRMRTPATPTSTSARSARPTCCGGNTSPVRRCSWCGSRASRTTRNIGDFHSAATSAACSPRPHNVFLVKFSYWLNM